TADAGPHIEGSSAVIVEVPTGSEPVDVAPPPVVPVALQPSAATRSASRPFRAVDARAKPSSYARADEGLLVPRDLPVSGPRSLRLLRLLRRLGRRNPGPIPGQRAALRARSGREPGRGSARAG